MQSGKEFFVFFVMIFVFFVVSSRQLTPLSQTDRMNECSFSQCRHAGSGPAPFSRKAGRPRRR
jgi:hypothetical protein